MPISIEQAKKRDKVLNIWVRERPCKTCNGEGILNADERDNYYRNKWAGVAVADPNFSIDICKKCKGIGIEFNPGENIHNIEKAALSSELGESDATPLFERINGNQFKKTE